MNPIERVVRRVDDVQQRRTWLAFPFAVVKKFGDDRAGNLGALIAYYGFFSLFPLLLVLVTVLGLVLRGHPGLRDRIVSSALGQFPVIGHQIQANSLDVSGVALAIGIVGAVWAGLGVTQAAQHAMNEIWGVPQADRPNFLASRGRGLAMLAILGAIVILSTFLTGLGTAHGIGPIVRVLVMVGSLTLNLALFMLVFRVLTSRRLTWADVLPGAVAGAVAWTILQGLGNYYVSHTVARAQATYGAFAFVIGLLVWIYLGARVTLYAAEINVVRKDRLWPRSLVQPPANGGDGGAVAPEP
jgi:YihY family inner membrane protein